MEDGPSHLIRVCTGLSCSVTGAADHLRALVRRLDVAPGSTTSDGRLMLEEADCLSLCSLAPVLEVDGTCHGRVTAAAVERVPMWFRTRRPFEVAVDAGNFTQVLADGRTARQRLADLHSRAEARARTRPESRFLVQGGSCGDALGAAEMIRALRLLVSMRGLDAEVLDGACHGMCSAGLVVEVQHAGWPRLTFTHLSTDVVPDFLSRVADGDSPLTRFEGMAWNADGWRGLPSASRHPFFARQRRVILERCGHLHPVSLDDALLNGGYFTLADVLDTQTPGGVIGALKAAAATEWEVCGQGAPGYFVVNGEEGTPGLVTDRHLMEGDPHRVLEGLLIAAYATGTTRGVLHINGAARFSIDRMARALAKIRAAGLIGDRILGSSFCFHLEIQRGGRDFVRGDEPALLSSFNAERPTAISNVETLAALPAVLARDIGGPISPDRSATRLLSVSGAVNHPGIVEVESGVTLRELLFDAAGGLRDGRALKRVVVVGWSRVTLTSPSLDGSIESEHALLAGTRGVIAVPD